MNCILVALLLLLASGYCIVHKTSYKRMRIVAYTTVAVYSAVQLVCAFTATLVGQRGNFLKCSTAVDIERD